MNAKLEAKLRDVADREEIRQVLMRYARGLDRLDNTLSRSCYWDDAIEDHGRPPCPLEACLMAARMRG